MIKQRGGLLVVAVAFLLLILAAPAFAAVPGVYTDGSGVAEIVAINEADCNLNITIDVAQGGTYYVQIYDDAALVFNQPYVQGGAGQFDAVYPITAPPGENPVGILIMVWGPDAAVLRSWVDLLVYSTGQQCLAIIVDGQCSTTAAIPRGAVVADLPFGGRAYWAPGKITPNVTLNPGTYWVTKVYVDNAGQVWNQIILACQYLWVPAEWMSSTATYDGPWNGEALPELVDSF
ncbi:MAG: hypothetical protein JNL42_10675 [Anaerolineae bacterium]|nr:hypothetical protein [Anaerolineae bacterium]